MIEYNPSKGQSRDLGQINVGETYLRGIAVSDKYVFAGSQPNAKLARFERTTGTVIPVDVPISGQSSVYDLTVAGRLLFVRVEPSNTLLIYDVESLELKDSVEKITGRVISGLDPTGSFVLFRMNNSVDPTGIYRYYVEDQRLEKFGFNPNAFPGSFRWHRMADQTTFPGYTLVMTYYRGRTYGWNPTSRRSFYIGESILATTLNPIQALGTGPDGKIYVPGFLSPPSMAQFDPESDTFTQLSGAGQVEGLGNFGDMLVMGRYPGGLLAAWDTARPWANGSNPTAPIEIGHEQDRPQALVPVGDEVAVASVPKSGRLGGALSLWNPRTNEVRSYLNLVPDQAPVSLAVHGGLLWVGTTINGGYGIDPVATEANLIAVDPETGETVFETTPWPGAQNVTALTLDDAGMLWGIADGALMQFDPSARKLIRIEQVFPVTKTMYGTANHMLFRSDGYIYATVAGSLWRVDPKTFERIRLASGSVKYLAQDADGQLYFARVSTLHRWNFGLPSAVDGSAPVSRVVLGIGGGSRGRVALELAASDEGGAGLDYIEYRLDGGPWRRYDGPILFQKAGPHTLVHRAVDKDRNVEGAQQASVTVTPAGTVNIGKPGSRS